MKKAQSLGIEYEITDLQGDLDGQPTGPARPQRLVDQDLAHLSGGLFDSVPRVEIPLDSFFPLPLGDLHPPPAPQLDTLLPPAFSAPARSNSLPPPALHARSDSLLPVAVDSLPPPAPAAGRMTGLRWSGMVVGAAVGMIAATLLSRPAQAPAAAAPAAPPPAVAVVAAAPAQVETTPAKATPTAPATKPSAAPAKAARPVVATPAPARAEAAPAPSAEPTAAPAAEIQPSAPPPSPLAALDAPVESLSSQRAAVAIASAGRGAAGCLEAHDARRTMGVSLTFAPSGNVTRAVIEGGPHRGTAAGSCIAQRLRSAVVPPFAGPAVTIRTTVTVR